MVFSMLFFFGPPIILIVLTIVYAIKFLSYLDNFEVWFEENTLLGIMIFIGILFVVTPLYFS